jgi:hypothetical protein
MPNQFLTQVPPESPIERNTPVEDIRLLSLTHKSLDGVLEDLGGFAGDLFRKLFGSTRYVVRGEIDAELQKLLRELENDSKQDRETKRRAIAIIIIGIEILKQTYMQEGVTFVQVG